MRWSRSLALMMVLSLGVARPVARAASEGEGGTIALLGEQVKGLAGENVGRVVNVLVDRDGRVRAAVIDFGGFLGVGSRKIAVDWRLLSFKLVDAKPVIVLALGRKELQGAPEYKPTGKAGEMTQMVGPSATEGAPPPSDKHE